jgi:hypothetical protein
VKRNQSGEEIALTAADVNDVAAALEANRLRSADGLEVAATPTGTALSLPGDPCAWFLLSGSSSPYSGTQQVPRPVGAWATGARSVTSALYEVNATASLDGKYIRACPGYPGDWRFYYRTRDTTEPPTPTTTCSTCNIPQEQLHLSFSYLNNASVTKTVEVVLTYWAANSFAAGVPAQDTWTSRTRPASVSCLATSKDFLNLPDYTLPYDPITDCAASCGNTKAHYWDLVCNFGSPASPFLRHSLYCVDTGGNTFWVGEYAMSLANSFTCSPFFASWTAPSGGTLSSDKACVLTVHDAPKPDKYAPTTVQPTRDVRRARGTDSVGPLT